jgi:HSP20 family molecular chaperone IbpA
LKWHLRILTISLLCIVWVPAMGWWCGPPGPYGPPLGAGWPYAGPRGTENRIQFAQSEQGYEVLIDLAGLRPEDVQVSVQQGVLVIASARGARRDWQGPGAFQYAYQYGHSYRRVPLPRDADTEHMTITPKEGTLEVLIPRKQ